VRRSVSSAVPQAHPMLDQYTLLAKHYESIVLRPRLLKLSDGIDAEHWEYHSPPPANSLYIPLPTFSRRLVLLYTSLSSNPSDDSEALLRWLDELESDCLRAQRCLQGHED
jgi:hypothetical protein